MDTRAKIDKKVNLLQHFIAATLALIVFMVSLPFVDSVLRYTADGGPAIEWQSALALTPVVRPGNTFEFEYTRQHHHQCPADLRRFILDGKGDIAVRFPLIPGGARVAEDTFKTVRSSVIIPARKDNGEPWVPGAYTYRMTAVRFCDDRIEYDTNVPDISFFLKTD
jgi:hypothetical protein